MIKSLWGDRKSSRREPSPRTPPHPPPKTSKNAPREPSPHTPPHPPPKRARSETPPPSTPPLLEDLEPPTSSNDKVSEPPVTRVSDEPSMGFGGEEDMEQNGDHLIDPPDPEDLVRAVQDLEELATEGSELRERISELPADLCNTSHCDSLKSRGEGQQLLDRVQNASQLLKNYNESLENEVMERRRVARMIYEFMTLQKILVTGLEKKIDTNKDRLTKMKSAEEAIARQIESLPELPPTDPGP
eukprot:TRINITY_DN14821_c0_g3_i1.p1 TRINITY_DN14821_c0_g3~~TRINITY_DN14821_c0_g3_i1.p1  ORF type:complete len:270 (+),score=37.89 TRINITY_DN14821_c0_g3_i1:80-811(+)